MSVTSKYTPKTPITELSGVGKTRAAQLTRLGINTVRDLVYHFPRAYQNRGDISPLGALDTESERSYILTVATGVKSAMIRRGMTVSRFRAFDESGSCEVVFFNSPYVKDVFHVGGVFRFFGKCSFNKANRLTLSNPKFEPVVEGIALEDFVPVYPLTEGLSSKTIEKLVKSAISECLPYIDDTLPEKHRLAYSLPTLSYAIKNMHFPESREALALAQKRLAFDEVLLFALAISFNKSKRDRGEGVPFSPCSLKPFCDLLGYELTNSQKQAVNDIYRDTVLNFKDKKAPPMARILVGDVGSGKTVCAELAMYIAAKSGYQSVLMAPTEILAAQHYGEISEKFSSLGINCALLTGSTKASEKKKIYADIASGKTLILVGTHAVLSDKLDFLNLGLIITDEQHRFGVAQRAVLKDKAAQAHMLVMSATPIPRTFALALWGDLDITRITDMPKGRMRVDTYVVNEGLRERVNGFIEKQVQLGGQCYVVCPAIEQEVSNTEYVIGSGGEIISGFQGELKSALERCEELKARFPALSISCLHGKMKAKEKDAIMLDFAAGKIDVLVSTTVIEVGINVPNASLMVVENADRFGLSQLHQLRGRVGRGTRRSFCVLVSDSHTESARARLDVMRTTYDGYEIADKDLLLRGPGDFFSSNNDNNLRQSGGLAFNMASRTDDPELVSKAFALAKQIVENDPELTNCEHLGLHREVMRIITPTSSIS